MQIPNFRYGRGTIISLFLGSEIQSPKNSLLASSFHHLWRPFGVNNCPRLFQLRKDFITCTQGTLSAGSYYSKIKRLWEELAEFRPVHHCVCVGVNPLIDHINCEYVLTCDIDTKIGYIDAKSVADIIP